MHVFSPASHTTGYQQGVCQNTPCQQCSKHSVYLAEKFLYLSLTSYIQTYPCFILWFYYSHVETVPYLRWSWHNWVWNARGNRGIQRKAGLTIAFFVMILPFSQRSKRVLKGHGWKLLCKVIITLEHMEHEHLWTRRNGWVRVKRAVYVQ